MKKEKTRVAILFGGRSTEHEISLLSAQNVYRSIDKEKFEPVLIAIDKEGKWHHNDRLRELLQADDPRKLPLENYANPILLSQNNKENKLVPADAQKAETEIDVIFPVLHGNFGEDGSIQGLARLVNIPCVGCGILGSAVGMDKDIMKRILRDADIDLARWHTVRYSPEGASYEEISAEFGNTLYIKPANLGSSVGITRAKNKKEFDEGLVNALQYDDKVIIEENITGREIECAVLGNREPRASIPGEIIPRDGFYSYENKYIDETGALLVIPAELEEAEIQRIQALAIKVYQLLECRGMARVDMFLTPKGQLILNEINTIPGFTNISMYPKLWEYSGVSQKELITELIRLAKEEHGRQNMKKLKGLGS